MDGFIGRRTELELLKDLLAPVRSGGRNGRPGRAVLIRGRRRVGKSRLVEEFLERTGLPHVFFTAVGGSKEGNLASLTTELAASSLPDADRFADFPTPQSWDAAFSLLASALPTDTPSIVVLDEMPYLVRQDPSFEGSLQKAFDRTLSKLPVLLILIGSDLTMMEQLNTYGRPFYQRGTEMVVPPLNPADVAAMLDLLVAPKATAAPVPIPRMITHRSAWSLSSYAQCGDTGHVGSPRSSVAFVIASAFRQESQRRCEIVVGLCPMPTLSCPSAANMTTYRQGSKYPMTTLASSRLDSTGLQPPGTRHD